MLSSPNVLWYGLAGWTHTKFNGDLDVRDDGGASVFAASYDFKSDGLTVGAGVEAMLTDNISWKTEYRYTDYSSVNIIDFGPAFNLDANTNVQSVRSVISWRF